MNGHELTEDYFVNAVSKLLQAIYRTDSKIAELEEDEGDESSLHELLKLRAEAIERHISLLEGSTVGKQGKET